MATCNEAIDMLVDFLDGSLSPELRQSVVKHLQTCKPCMHFVEGYKKTTTLARKILLKPAPDDLQQRLHSFLRQNTTSPSDGPQHG